MEVTIPEKIETSLNDMMLRIQVWTDMPKSEFISFVTTIAKNLAYIHKHSDENRYVLIAGNNESILIVVAEREDFIIDKINERNANMTVDLGTDKLVDLAFKEWENEIEVYTVTYRVRMIYAVKLTFGKYDLSLGTRRVLDLIIKYGINQILLRPM